MSGATRGELEDAHTSVLIDLAFVNVNICSSVQVGCGVQMDRVKYECWGFRSPLPIRGWITRAACWLPSSLQKIHLFIYHRPNGNVKFLKEE